MLLVEKRYFYFILIIVLCAGNLTAAIDLSFLRSNRINYILTVDSCPLPEVILDLRDIHIMYIQGNDKLLKLILNLNMSPFWINEVVKSSLLFFLLYTYHV